MNNLSSVLKQRRKELGLTLAQIADMMDVTEATVQRWESGNIKSVRHEKIWRLAEILKVTPSTLMGWTDIQEGEDDLSSESANSKNNNIIKIAGRDGSYQERRLSDEQLAALRAILDQMPDATDDL